MTTGTPQSSLVITRKEETSRDPKVLPTSFRQIENWANSGKWQPLSFAANWSNFNNGNRTGQFYVDPFGFVCVRGTIKYAGTLTGSTAVNLATFPPGLVPSLTESGIVAGGPNEPTFQWLIQPNGGSSSFLQIILIATTTNPVILLGGGSQLSWAPFN